MGLFRTQPVTRIVEVTPEPQPGDPRIDADHRLEMSVTGRELAALFAYKGWLVDGAKSGVPSAEEILGIFIRLADSLNNGSDAAYNTTARLMVIKDSDFPSSTDLYLYVGHLSEPPSDDTNSANTSEVDTSV
ncbi:hypothetical protein AB0M54_45820 [Actinoplanes sp. NPDC051470]|uniref:hypothetical protein n=1 Tax=Actinoplanes sp. NPDC051470 TaxID=3157224 RepID=UPI003432B40B